MATVKGVNSTKLASNPVQLSDLGQHGGNVKSIYDSYTLTADLSANDVILMGGLIPQNARVIDVRLVNPALGAGTLHVGWLASADASVAADADGFLASAAVTNAASYSMFEDQSSVPGYQKVFSAAVQPAITVATDTSATSGTVHLEVLYVID